MTGSERSPREDTGDIHHINIHASHGGVAAWNIGTVVIDGLAELKAATTVLPLEALVDDDPPFVGRAFEKSEIAGLLGDADDGSANIIVVSGPPGVGKSALVRQAAATAQAAGRFSQVLFVDLRGYAEDPEDRVLPAIVLSKLLILLGIADEDIATEPAEQAIQYHRRLSELAAQSQAVLLWLDNASDSSQFDPLRPAAAIHKAAVTTRETFGYIPKPQVVELAVMTSDEAIELLTSSMHQRNPGDRRIEEAPELARRIAELCDHLPLALQIVAALLADEPDRPISEVVDELVREEDRLTSLEYSASLSVRAAFALSYSRLPDNLQRLFRLMSVIPGGDVGVVAAGWLISAKHTAVRPQLMALVRSHLIQQHVRHRFSMHDLIRLYATEMSASDPEDAERAFKSIVVHYGLGVGAAGDWLTGVPGEKGRRLLPSPQHAAAWFDAERTTVIAVVMAAARRLEYRQIALALAVALGEILGTQRHWLKEFHDVATVGASLVPDAQDRHYAGVVMNHYGSALRMMGQFDAALAAYQRAVEVAEEAGDFAVADAARGNMGNVYLEQGRDIDEVLEIYWADVRACRESDPPNRLSEAVTLANIGAALAMAERYAEAEQPLRDAIAIQRDLEHQPGIASAAKNLGATLSRLGLEEDNPQHCEEAIELLQEAAEIYRVRGNVSGWADVTNNLGQTQCQIRRYAEGIPNIAAALQYLEGPGQSKLADDVRQNLQSYRQEAAGQRPWAAATLANSRYRFTNVSGAQLTQITVDPIGATVVEVEGSPDPHSIAVPLNDGDSFVAIMRGGGGVRVTATRLPSLAPVTMGFSL
ncbi:AAA family ATPase [Mycolicibacterium peregrinum]|uniref:AAA family ATPase n=1 Tax=Mycolicibacterium peregrinum TaxID=43304 RepID=UPI0018E30A4F|nr:AAA family ATPase [Mycolicibacterium peregrinum]